MKNSIFQNEKSRSSLLLIAIASYLFFSMISISLSQIFLFLSLVFWIIVIIQERPKPVFPSFFWPLMVYSGLSIVSSILSVNPEISLKDSRELLLFLIVPIVYTGLAKSQSPRKINLALLASGILSCLYSIFYFIIQASPGERISGFMGHYMTQAGLLALFCCMALSMFLFSRDKIRYAWGAGFFLALFALTLTLTRSAWVSLVVAISIILLFYKPRTIIIVPVAAGLLFLFSPKNVKNRALSIFSLKTSTNQQRIEYLKTGIKIIGEFPFFGTGPDTVDLFFQNPKYELSEEAKKNVHLHNNITQIGAERGILTLLTWLTVLVWIFVTLLRLVKNKDFCLKAFTVAALSGLSALFIAGLFEYNFGDSEITTLFLYMMTAPFSLAQSQKGSIKSRRGKS